MAGADKPHAPSCERNREPILAVLQQHLPAQGGRLLEIGSGTGQHAVYFAQALPRWRWQCSDCQQQLAGISQWLDEAALGNTPPPLALDVTGDWPETGYEAVFSANTLHIMAWPAVQLFFAGVGRVLASGGLLVVYGPFNYHGEFSSPSNREFDAWLKARDPQSGIRDFEAVDALARGHGLQLVEDLAMPANNRCLLWRRVS
ncbi:DUF938 domain-containing protein [Pseudoxanthomonas dokdonensis]|uniref:Methylase n=1 Tax=Pseudoxanthomonas dokdonensis TaxID=344882 RepID=A0A0R0CQ11_9GAMM|nr:DUF938 domain-containing protein [Pseudoxanthomonas dokdonensis]KRG72029.1 methylase [Pseudoxanthomonas dokdonensis]